MEFQSTKGIFLQIAENICHQIMDGTLPTGERVPSVRDLAADFEVNRNTVLHTYTFLNDAGIFENKRGVGYFVSGNAVELILKSEKEAFFSNELPVLIHKAKMLKLNTLDLNDLITVLKNNDNNENK